MDRVVIKPREGEDHLNVLSPMSLLDTTQLALESAMSGSMLRHYAAGQQPGQRRHPRLPAPGRQLPGHAAAAIQSGQPLDEVTFQPYTPSRQVSADGNGVSAEQQSAQLAENGLLYQTLTQVAAQREYDPPDRDGDRTELMSFFDAIDIAASGLTAEPHADGRHRREPRQRRDHAAAPTASPTSARRSSSSRSAASARRSPAR